MRITNFSKSNAANVLFHRLIPGGSHTYAKGDDQFPEDMAPIIARGKGSHVWDLDGNEFIEYGMGLRAVTLGHAHDRVNDASYAQMKLGNNYTRPAAIEYECAAELRKLIPSAEMVKFGKNGSDVTDAAIKLARAFTGRDLVAICADHPFFSVNDWFIGTTPMCAGIPQAVRDLTLRFRYNDLSSLEKLFAAHSGKIACVILEAEKVEEPRDRFLHRVQDLCHQHGAVFILDEMITGFRWHLNGAQAMYDIKPDLSTFGKGLGNGFSVSALVGRRDIMELGGLDHGKDRVYLLSLTHGAENSSLAAALEVMRIYQNEPVIETMWKQGARLQQGMESLIAKHGVDGYFGVMAKPCCLLFGTKDADKKPSQPFRTLFIKEMLHRGVIAPSFIVSAAHTDVDIDLTIEAADGALAVYRQALDEGIEKHLTGKSVKPVWRTRN